MERHRPHEIVVEKRELSKLYASISGGKAVRRKAWKAAESEVLAFYQKVIQVCRV